VPFFNANSEVEQGFLQYCEALGIAIHRKTIIEYDGTSGGAEFLYLTLKDDEGRCIDEEKLRFIDKSTACPGGGDFGICCRGARQVGAVALNPSCLDRLAILGVAVARHPFVPKIYLLSRELAQVLIELKATGCEIAPCDCTPWGSSVGGDCPCYQLRIIERTDGPAKLGQVRMGKRCPVCGAAKLFLSSEERYFFAHDLKRVDFQICSSFEGENVGRFETSAGFPIVSERMFRELLRRNTNGLDRYSTDPPIQHAVVQVRA
jgi:hypothetical protein